MVPTTPASRPTRLGAVGLVTPNQMLPALSALSASGARSAASGYTVAVGVSDGTIRTSALPGPL